MNRPVRAVIAATFALGIAALPSVSFAESAAVATVNGSVITEDDVNLALTDLAEQFARVPEDQRRAAAVSALVEIRLMAQKARDEGIDQTETFKAQLRLVEDRVLHQAVIDRDVAGKITDETMRKRYDEEVAARPAENEVKARHILVKTKEEAEALIKQLQDGADFETLANDNTTDPSGKGSGGDLGYFGRGMMVPAFEEAAFSLDPGAYTTAPVETQFGFHVIKTEDKRVKQPPAFETVKDQIRSLMIREAYLDLVQAARDAADISYQDEAIKALFEAEAPKP